MDFLVLTQLAAACTAEHGILAVLINPALIVAGLISKRPTPRPNPPAANGCGALEALPQERWRR